MNRRNWLELSRKLVDQFDLDYTINSFNGALEKQAMGFFGEGVLVTTMYPNPFIITMSAIVLGGSVGDGYAYDPNGQATEITPTSPTSKDFLITASDPVNPRWDLLVLRFVLTGDTPVPKPSDPITTIDLNLHDDFELAVIAGIPSPTPAYPAKGVNDIILAGLQVHALDTIGTQVFVDMSIREIAQPFVPQMPVFIDEIPTGVISGSNVTFTLSETPITPQSLLFFVDDLKLRPSEYSLSGVTVTLVVAPVVGQNVQVWYIENSPASQNPLVAFDLEIGTGDGSTTTFPFSGQPISKGSTQVYVDGLKIPQSEWDLVLVAPDSAEITFHAGSIPGPGQGIDVVFFVNANSLGIGPTGSGVQTVVNYGAGTGHIAIGISANELQIKTLKQGSNVVITETATEITVALSPSAGSSRWAPYGTPGVPLTILPAVSIAVSPDDRQLRFIDSAGGAVPMTAVPQIAVGTIVGQELLLVGTSDVDYIILHDGDGLKLNGAANMKNNQTLSLFWNGSNWAEITRR